MNFLTRNEGWVDRCEAKRLGGGDGGVVLVWSFDNFTGQQQH